MSDLIRGICRTLLKIFYKVFLYSVQSVRSIMGICLSCLSCFFKIKSKNQNNNKPNKKLNKNNQQKKNCNKSGEESGFIIPESQSLEECVSDLPTTSYSSETAGSSKNTPKKSITKSLHTQKQDFNDRIFTKKDKLKNAIPTSNHKPIPIQMGNKNRSNNPTKQADNSRPQGFTKKNGEKKYVNRPTQQDQINTQYSTSQINPEIPNLDSKKQIINTSMPMPIIPKAYYNNGKQPYEISSDNMVYKPSEKQIDITNNISNLPNPTVLNVKVLNDNLKPKPLFQSASENKSQHKNIDRDKHLHIANNKYYAMETSFDNVTETKIIPSNAQLDTSFYNQTKMAQDNAYFLQSNLYPEKIDHQNTLPKTQDDDLADRMPKLNNVLLPYNKGDNEMFGKQHKYCDNQESIYSSGCKPHTKIYYNSLENKIIEYKHENVPNAQNNYCYINDNQPHSQIIQCFNQDNKNFMENTSFFQSNSKEFEKQTLMKTNNAPKEHNTKFKENIVKSKETFTTANRNLFETRDTKSDFKPESIKATPFPRNVNQDAVEYSFDDSLSILPEYLTVQHDTAMEPNIDKIAIKKEENQKPATTEYYEANLLSDNQTKINIEKELMNKNSLETQNALSTSTMELKRVELTNTTSKNTKSIINNILHKQEREKEIIATSNDKINVVSEQEIPIISSKHFDQGHYFKGNSCVDTSFDKSDIEKKCIYENILRIIPDIHVSEQENQNHATTDYYEADLLPKKQTKINIEKEPINKNSPETHNVKQLCTVKLKRIELANTISKNTKSTIKNILHKSEKEKEISAASDDVISEQEIPIKTYKYFNQGDYFKDNSFVDISSADSRINESFTPTQLPSNYIKSCYNSNKLIDEDSFKPKVETTTTKAPTLSSDDENDKPSCQASDIITIEEYSSELKKGTVITNISSNEEGEANQTSYILHKHSEESGIDANNYKNILSDELHGFKHANSDNSESQSIFSGFFFKSTEDYEQYSDKIYYKLPNLNNDGFHRYLPSTVTTDSGIKSIKHNTIKQNSLNTLDSSNDDLKQQIHDEKHCIKSFDDLGNMSLLGRLNSDKHIDLEDSLKNISLPEQTVIETKSKHKTDEETENVGEHFIENLAVAVAKSSTTNTLPAIEQERIDTDTQKKELQDIVPDGVDPNIYKSVTTFLDEIRRKAEPFIHEIENFTGLADSNKYYYIEESLRRLIDKLDDMFEDIGDNKVLRDKRKEIYKFIFPLFERLDKKEAENRAKIQ